MQKVILITGPAKSGKSTVADALSKVYSKNHILKIEGKGFDTICRFGYSGATPETDVVIIDDLSLIIWDEIYSLSEGILVNQQMKERFIIHPKVIITCSTLLLQMPFNDYSFQRRIKLIQL